MKTFILIAIILFLALYSARGIFRHFTGKDGCSCGSDKKDGGCGCGDNCNCGGSCNCHSDENK